MAAVHTAIRCDTDRPCMPHSGRHRLKHFNVMPGLFELLNQSRIKPVLQFQAACLLPPRLAKQPARRIKGGLQGLTKQGMAREKGRLGFAAALPHPSCHRPSTVRPTIAPRRD